MQRKHLGRLLQYLISKGYRPLPVDTNSRTMRIECPGLEVNENTVDHLHEVKHFIYDFFDEIGYNLDHVNTKLGRESRMAYSDGWAAKIMVTPNDKMDFVIVSQLLAKNISLSATKPRISFKRPAPTRQSTGQNLYNIYFGKQPVGRIYCDQDTPDAEKQVWQAELHDGYDPLEYDQVDDPTDVPCVTSRDGKLCLVNPQALTVAQAKSWVRTSFDRTQWESSLIPF